jgi:hypothetical protein
MFLKLGILVSTYSLIFFKTLFGVRCAFGGRLLTSLNPRCGTTLARSSCAILLMGENCFHSGCRSTKSWCTTRERSTTTWNHFFAVGDTAGGVSNGSGTCSPDAGADEYVAEVVTVPVSSDEGRKMSSMSPVLSVPSRAGIGGASMASSASDCSCSVGSSVGTAVSRAKRIGEALRACCAPSGVR